MHLHDLIVAALDTGARRGELLTLQWSQVEYHEQPDAQGHAIPRFLLLPPTKTKTKTRQLRRIPVSARLRGVLARRRVGPDGEPHALTGFVFGNAVAEEVKSIKTAWLATCRRARIVIFISMI